MSGRGAAVTAAVGLGSNIGDRMGYLREAVGRLRLVPGLEVQSVSSVYESAAVLMTDQPDFLNAAARLRCSLQPVELLEVCLGIELAMGRVRAGRWGPRNIDLDILLYGTCRVDIPGLTVPHPGLTQRAFALAPLLDVWPDACLPSGEPLASLLTSEMREMVRPAGLLAP